MGYGVGKKYFSTSRIQLERSQSPKLGKFSIFSRYKVGKWHGNAEKVENARNIEVSYMSYTRNFALNSKMTVELPNSTISIFF